ncbi:hypothetical protein Agub_g3003 [Astrephomene gubernaculifera]|uniref:Haem-binding uptake Tiki superfamily ChaN domain-containing protein n=1 Tax=Astrephomene gubernaculifera TaxID=47775 RepID=A0AAD3DLN2_9CHLO|nr:hypothetical protein Agub_g3003 [Astrephomene gubernaculifera]
MQPALCSGLRHQALRKLWLLASQSPLWSQLPPCFQSNSAVAARTSSRGFASLPSLSLPSPSSTAPHINLQQQGQFSGDCREPACSSGRRDSSTLAIAAVAAASLLATSSSMATTTEGSSAAQFPSSSSASTTAAPASQDLVVPFPVAPFRHSWTSFQLQNQEPRQPPASSPSPSPSPSTSSSSASPGPHKQQHQQPQSPSSSGTSAPPPPPRPSPRPPPPPPPSYKEGAAFAVYDSAAAPASFSQLLASLDSYDVVLLGEYHDDPVAHALQLRVLRHVLGLGEEGEGEGREGEQGQGREGKRVAEAGGRKGGEQQRDQQQQQGPQQGRRRRVALSLEMFERDVQCVMDEYLAGVLTEADLMKDARPWPNYSADYRPLVLAARQAGARVVCANAPRRYVSLVGRSGSAALQSLPPASRRHLPPLPLQPPSAAYAAKIRWTMQRAREASQKDASSDSSGAGEQQQQEEEEEVAAPLASPAAAAAAAASSTGSASSGSNGSSGNTGTSSAGTTTTSTTSSSGGGGGGGVCPHIGMSLRSNFLEAQNVWDATMADSIARALREMRGEGCGAGETEGQAAGGEAGSGGEGGGSGGLVVHVCGKFHSEQRLGICEHLASLAPAPRVCVVTFLPSGRGVALPQAQLQGARLHTCGDWLVVTDGRLPRSFVSEHPV